MSKKSTKPKTVEQWIGINCVTRLTVDLPDDLHAKFKSITSAKRTKMSAVILKMVKSYVDKEAKNG